MATAIVLVAGVGLLVAAWAYRSRWMISIAAGCLSAAFLAEAVRPTADDGWGWWYLICLVLILGVLNVGARLLPPRHTTP